MNSIERLGQIFKERDNKISVNITTGEVISISPLRIKWGENVLLGISQIVLANILKDGFEVQHGETTVIIKNPLKAGDRVIMVPDDNFKNWYVIDKVG